MKRRNFLRALAAGAGSLALASPAHTLPHRLVRRPITGINSHLLTPESVALLRRLGVVHIRHTLYWPLWNNPGFPAAYAANLERAHRAGLRLTLVVHNWDGGAVFGSGVSRRMMSEFASFVAARVRDFPQVEAWQLWNEQDVWVQAPFGASTRVPMIQRGRLYAEQLERAYPLIKRANPRALVVSGGTADHPSSGFLEGMMESRPPMDAVAVHGYGDYTVLRDRISAARSIVDGHAPVWVTEAGDDAPQRNDDARHLRVWRSIIEGNERDGLADRIYPYVLLGGETERGQGLVRGDGSPRPTYEWLRRRLRSR
jgi:hypothetical protein